ncbi:MAG: cytochrome c oxidase subunit 3 [Sulfobacillus sp.]
MNSTTIRLPPSHPGIPPEFADPHEGIKILGFWLFLTTDVLIFASLFSVYAVYRSHVAHGPSPLQMVHIGTVLAETLALLTSSFTVGLSIFGMRTGRPRFALVMLVMTMALGLVFLSLEVHEFVVDVGQGATWHRSAFLSCFYVLIGTHGSHVTFGFFWALGILIQWLRRGLTTSLSRQLFTFSLYWHFLDIIWVFIFTVVYLMSPLPVR